MAGGNLVITIFQSILPFLPLAKLTQSISWTSQWPSSSSDNIYSSDFFYKIPTPGAFLWQLEAPAALSDLVHTSLETWHLCWLLVWDRMSNKRDWKMQRLLGKWPEKGRQSSWLLMGTCWARPAGTRIESKSFNNFRSKPEESFAFSWASCGSHTGECWQS